MTPQMYTTTESNCSTAGLQTPFCITCQPLIINITYLKLECCGVVRTLPVHSCFGIKRLRTVFYLKNYACLTWLYNTHFCISLLVVLWLACLQCCLHMCYTCVSCGNLWCSTCTLTICRYGTGMEPVLPSLCLANHQSSSSFLSTSIRSPFLKLRSSLSSCTCREFTH